MVCLSPIWFRKTLSWMKLQISFQSITFFQLKKPLGEDLRFRRDGGATSMMKFLKSGAYIWESNFVVEASPADRSLFDSRIKPLALLKLLFPCTAPTFYASDHWVHYLTDGPVFWIPGHHFPIAVLIWLIRSATDIKCSSRWFGMAVNGEDFFVVISTSYPSRVAFSWNKFMSQFKMVKQR